MATVKVLKVILKGDDWTFSHKYLIYDEIKLEREDPVVRGCIQDARSRLKMEPDEEEVKCTMLSK